MNYKICNFAKQTNYQQIIHMDFIKRFALIGLVALFLSSCGSTAKFPTSSVAPAADITATKKKTKNDNYNIKLTVKNLAEASRLSPAKENYSVWIVTDDNQTKNIGQLIFKNGEKATLNTTTAFNVREIFITAEDEEGLSYPRGTEISRTTFSK